MGTISGAQFSAELSRLLDEKKKSEQLLRADAEGNVAGAVQFLHELASRGPVHAKLISNDVQAVQKELQRDTRFVSSKWDRIVAHSSELANDLQSLGADVALLDSLEDWVSKTALTLGHLKEQVGFIDTALDNQILYIQSKGIKSGKGK